MYSSHEVLCTIHMWFCALTVFQSSSSNNYWLNFQSAPTRVRWKSLLKRSVCRYSVNVYCTYLWCQIVCNFVLIIKHTLITLQGAGTLQPPISLLEFQPLAIFCNNILTAFNDLRLCAPLSLASNAACLIQESLKHAADVILQYHR